MFLSTASILLLVPLVSAAIVPRSNRARTTRAGGNDQAINIMTNVLPSLRLHPGAPMHKGQADGNNHLPSDMILYAGVAAVGEANPSKQDICSAVNIGNALTGAPMYNLTWDIPMEGGKTINAIWIGENGVGVLDIYQAAGGNACGKIVHTENAPRVNTCVGIPGYASCLHYWWKGP